MIDLCLVNPNGRLPAPFAAIEPPLWLGLIAGSRLAQGQEVAVVDAEAEGLTIVQTVQRVRELSPQEIIIVVMGNNPSVSSTPKMPLAEQLLQELPTAKLAGLHPNAVNYPNTVRQPFTGFPSVPWHLFPLTKYRAHNWHCLGNLRQRNHYGILYTSLNCPFKCSYCNIHALYGGQHLLARPLEDIKADLLTLALHGFTNLKIWDELFCLDEKKVSQVCDFISQWHLNFNIWAYARVDTVTEKMLGAMEKAGFTWLGYGFESSQGSVRQGVGKRFTDMKVRRAIDMTRAAGLNIIANFMFGLPGETLDDMKATLAWAIEENFEYANFNVALPYPGSPWWDSLVVKPTDWSSFSQFSPHIYADPKVVKFRDDAFRAYFNRPEYLALIRHKFGSEAEAHIHEMLKWQPERSNGKRKEVGDGKAV